jgi:CBS domain-containing protein/sporulation protein YlmC with PRC-barrel domain
MKYLTQILGKRILAPDGRPIGKIQDAIAIPEGRLPALEAVVIRTPKGERLLPYEALEFDADPLGPEGSGQIPGDLRLKMPIDQIPAYQPSPNALRLRQDVLDRQIVDVQGYRVVRVSDVRLAECAGHYCVVGVDASLRATLRRLGGISQGIEAVARLLGRPLRSNLIAWDDVQTLEPGANGGRIWLKESKDKIARLHPADIADIVEQLSPMQRAEVIEALDTETMADTLTEVEPKVQKEIMGQLDVETAADILEHMEPDDAADLLEELPDARSDELIRKMQPEEAEEVSMLLAYPEDTAGGLMTTELVAIPAGLTCEATIHRLRELAPKAETIYYVYVVDDDSRLVGVLSLRDLVIAPPETHIGDIMVQNVIHVYVEDHANEVAQVLARYNLLAVPVVNEEEKLLGIITVDDTLERLLPPERRRRLPLAGLRATDDE